MHLIIKITKEDGSYSAELQSPDGVPMLDVGGLPLAQTVEISKGFIDTAFEVLG